MFNISGNIIDISQGCIYPGTIRIQGGKIQSVRALETKETQFILPGFIDAHIHIESSLLVPSEFARLAAVHGTVAAVSDPHEIANVLGLKGIDFMLDNAAKVPFKFFFGAPACVPATPFETTGAKFGPDELHKLLNRNDIYFLSEMMNVPGVLNDSPQENNKLNLARLYGKQADGHSPGLRGAQAARYAKAGISTDHECLTLEEAREKIGYGMKILIREGSAARNLNELMPLIDEFPQMVMFCSDDRHPDDLVDEHIRHMVLRAIKAGLNLFNILQAACLNPIDHYGLDVGKLKKGDSADFIVIDNLEEMNIMAAYNQGQKTAEDGRSLISRTRVEPINIFRAQTKSAADYSVPARPGKLKVIEVIEDQLITGSILAVPRLKNENAVQDLDNDILKITVVNRYENRKPAVGFIKNFGLKKGALASSVAHDSHNIVAIGVTDEDLALAVNLVINNKGGLAAVAGKEEMILPLPVGGIMSALDGYETARAYKRLNAKAKALGTGLKAPFMTLSFMALLVIPDLKLSDQGLFDGKTFQFTDLFSN
ncbi:MAG: adenine deaminase [Candidatus Neomarinimicrobiota bacterium]